MAATIAAEPAAGDSTRDELVALAIVAPLAIVADYTDRAPGPVSQRFPVLVGAVTHICDGDTIEAQAYWLGFAKLMHFRIG